MLRDLCSIYDAIFLAGVEFNFIPEVNGKPLICDMSSNIMTRDIDVTKVNMSFELQRTSFPIILDHYSFEKNLQKLNLGGIYYH